MHMIQDDYARIEQAIQFIETHVQSQPDLAAIAAHVGLSEYHFQRLFKRWAGITPKRFLQYLTAEYARDLLQASQNVLDTAYEVGLSGPGRLHDLTVNIHAMTPGEVANQGEGLTIRYGLHRTPFGMAALAMTARGICALRFVSDGETTTTLAGLQDEWANAAWVEDQAATALLVAQIFAASRGEEPLHLHVQGTNFQIRVWEALIKVPSGAVCTYGDLAQQVGMPNASRAVGSAVGRNPVAYLIPCHRVIRQTGAFGDYRWGAARKKAMLAWEAAQAS